MPKYQKAVLAKQIKEFQGWKNSPSAAEYPLLDDEAVVFVQEDLRVTDTCFEDANTIFVDESAGWGDYCRTVLGFSVPDWDGESAMVKEAVAKTTATTES